MDRVVVIGKLVTIIRDTNPSNKEVEQENEPKVLEQQEECTNSWLRDSSSDFDKAWADYSKSY